jgi:hypothetical protein
MFFGPITKKENKHLEDINGRELVALAPLIDDDLRHRALPEHLPLAMKDAVARVRATSSARSRRTRARASTTGRSSSTRRARAKLPRARNAPPAAAPDSSCASVEDPELRRPNELALSRTLSAPRRRRRRDAADAGGGVLSEAPGHRDSGLALGRPSVFGGRGVRGGGLAVRVEQLDGLASSPPGSSSTASRSSSTCVLCLGGALAALLAGGYLPEHNLDRGEFYSLLLFATFGAMMLAARATR